MVDSKRSMVIITVYCPGGGIGIRGRLRACAHWAWRFESSPGHHEKTRLNLVGFFVLAISYSWSELFDPTHNFQLGGKYRLSFYHRTHYQCVIRPSRICGHGPNQAGKLPVRVNTAVANHHWQ